MATKLEQFNPLEYNLLERDFFEAEKTNIYTTVRLKVRELEQKIRNV
jgi:hypothetical protein